MKALFRYLFLFILFFTSKLNHAGASVSGNLPAVSYSNKKIFNSTENIIYSQKDITMSENNDEDDEDDEDISISKKLSFSNKSNCLVLFCVDNKIKSLTVPSRTFCFSSRNKLILLGVLRI